MCVSSFVCVSCALPLLIVLSESHSLFFFTILFIYYSLNACLFSKTGRESCELDERRVGEEFGGEYGGGEE